MPYSCWQGPLFFFTGLSGRVDYCYFEPKTQIWSKNLYSVPGPHTDPDKSVAATYNTDNNNIEVYWQPEDTHNNPRIHYAYHSVDDFGYQIGDWHGSEPIDGGGHAGEALSAVFYQDSVNQPKTAIAFYDQDHDISGRVQYIGYEKVKQNDGTYKTQATVEGTYPIGDQPLTSSDCGPYLVDLSERYMALLWKTDHDSGPFWMKKYDKTKDTWDFAKQSANPDGVQHWIPTAAVNYEESSDGVFDAILYLFYGKDSGWTQSKWSMTSIEKVGFWKQKPKKEANFKEQQNQTFSQWPLLFLVDAPPFVLNGNDPEEYECTLYGCTETSLTVAKESSKIIEGEMEIGAYAETGKRSPIKASFSTGFIQSKQYETSFSMEDTRFIDQSVEGKLMGLFLAPNITTWKFQWHDEHGNPTDTYAYPMQISGANVVKKIFDPEDGPTFDPDHGQIPDLPQPYMEIPAHGSPDDLERLQTYQNYPAHQDPENSQILFSESGGWYASSPEEITWGVSEVDENTVGGYVDFKIGAEMKKLFGVGMEGSFTMKVTSNITRDVTIEMKLKNPEPGDEGHIEGFDLKAYWLQPKPGSDPYWLPVNRQGFGDVPGFITYKVTDIYQQES